MKRKIIKRNKAFLSARLRECTYSRFYGEREFVVAVAPAGYARAIRAMGDHWVPISLWRNY